VRSVSAGLVNLRRKLMATLPALSTVFVTAAMIVVAPAAPSGASSCTQASTGIVSVWQGEGSGADSQGLNHAVEEGGVSYVPGKIGSAFSFDGIDDDLLIPASTSLQLETAFTLEFWFSFPFDVVPGSPAFTRGNTFVVKDWSDFLVLQNGGGDIELGANSPRMYSSTKSWLADIWYHVALTYDAGTYHMYVNGTLESSLYRDEPLLGDNEEMYFSHHTATPHNPPMWFEQRLDEIAIYNRALTAAEVVDRASGCTPIYTFTGFFAPVDNLPVVNTMNAGRAVPVKFSLAGYQGLDIMADEYPRSEQIACDSTSLVDGVEETTSAGSSSLSYDGTIDQYKYVWKTDSSWADTCRQFVLKLDDGTYHRTNFRFT
jgi:hypothetical protein